MINGRKDKTTYSHNLIKNCKVFIMRSNQDKRNSEKLKIKHLYKALIDSKKFKHRNPKEKMQDYYLQK